MDFDTLWYNKHHSFSDNEHKIIFTRTVNTKDIYRIRYYRSNTIDFILNI